MLEIISSWNASLFLPRHFSERRIIRGIHDSLLRSNKKGHVKVPLVRLQDKLRMYRNVSIRERRIIDLELSPCPGVEQENWIIGSG
jgi:hypothetical protein